LTRPEQKAKPISHLISELENATSSSRLMARSRSTPRRRAGSDHRRSAAFERTWAELTQDEKNRLPRRPAAGVYRRSPRQLVPGPGHGAGHEEVIDGKSEVGGFPVERRPMRQWMLRITKYADRLVKDLDDLQ